MIFKEMSNSKLPTIILIHGGGLSNWSWNKVAVKLQSEYHVITPIYKMLYGLVKKRWFSKIQAKALCVPNDMFEIYYQDSLKMSKQSLVNIALSNGNYCLKDSISKTQAKVLIIVGSKEIGLMKKSASLLHKKIVGSKLYIGDGMKHGEMSLVYTEDYIKLIKSFFK